MKFSKKIKELLITHITIRIRKYWGFNLLRIWDVLRIKS
jgi:hypothetical protein